MPQALSSSDIAGRLKNQPNWVRQDGAIVRVIEFPNFLKGLEFVNRLAQEAERMDHHPKITLEYKRVTVEYSTHSANGITDLDFQAASAVDKLLK